MDQIIKRAKEEANEELAVISSEAQKKFGIGRLIYLTRKEAVLRSELYSSTPMFMYEFKCSIIVAMEAVEFKSLPEEELRPSFSNFQDRFSLHQESINDVKEPGEYSNDIFNSLLFPAEVASVAQKTGKRRIVDFSFEDLAQEIMKRKFLLDEVDNLIHETALEASISDEDFERIRADFQGKFIWMNQASSIAYLFHQLEIKDWLKLSSKDMPLTDYVKAGILLSHFQVFNRGYQKGKEISLSSMKNNVQGARTNEIKELSIGYPM